MSTPYIDHIGIVVADLDTAIDRLKPVFGDDIEIKELPDVGLRVADFRTRNLTIELLQYTGDNNGDASVFARGVMGDHPGLNHVSARVENVEEAVRDLGEKGFTAMDGFPMQGAHGRVAFFHPDDTTGLLLEVCSGGADEDS